MDSRNQTKNTDGMASKQKFAVGEINNSDLSDALANTDGMTKSLAIAKAIDERGETERARMERWAEDPMVYSMVMDTLMQGPAAVGQAGSVTTAMQKFALEKSGLKDTPLYETVLKRLKLGKAATSRIEAPIPDDWEMVSLYEIGGYAQQELIHLC